MLDMMRPLEAQELFANVLNTYQESRFPKFPPSFDSGSVVTGAASAFDGRERCLAGIFVQFRPNTADGRNPAPKNPWK